MDYNGEEISACFKIVINLLDHISKDMSMDVGSLIPAGLQSSRLNLTTVPAGYNKLSEHLRKFTPSGMQCAIFCGGSRCKYENPKTWHPVHMAIQDVFSHWVTEDVLAMARPNTEQIVKRKIVSQFQAWGIKTIINLQTPGEHASCGGPLEDSGFTYDPNIFMANEIYYYNFAWKDYGDATLGKLLDMVKVVAFAVQEGRVAIHCHAGLGRTGVLIACYLVYSLRVRANDAIRFVRLKRPNAVQTRGQILCVQEFEHYILPQMTVFPIRDPTTSSTNKLSSASNNRAAHCGLRSYIRKQRNILHGYEQRTFKYVPKLLIVTPSEYKYQLSVKQGKKWRKRLQPGCRPIACERKVAEYEISSLDGIIIFHNRTPFSCVISLDPSYDLCRHFLPCFIDMTSNQSYCDIVFVICERLLQLCDCQTDNSPSEIEFIVSNVPFTQKFLCSKIVKNQEDGSTIQHSYSWADSLADTSLGASSICEENTIRSDIVRDNQDSSGISCSSPDAPSCVSEYSVLDDNVIDDVLGDGIRDQNLYENGCYKELKSRIDLKEEAVKNEVKNFENSYEIAKALLLDYNNISAVKQTMIRDYQVDLNNRETSWQRLELETDIQVLTALLYDWMEELKYPILDIDDLSLIVVWNENVEKCLEKLEIIDGFLIEYLLRFILRLRPLSTDCQNLLIKRLMASLTQQSVTINQTILPSGKDFGKLRSGTSAKLTNFLIGLMNYIMEITTMSIDRSLSTISWSTTTGNSQDENETNDENKNSEFVQNSDSL